MALTKDFRVTIKARAERDVEFRLALLRESMDCLLEGDVQAGKTMLRDYINATMGFETLASRVKTPPKSLHRMFGSKGNPRADNLFRILTILQRAEHVGARVQFSRAA